MADNNYKYAKKKSIETLTGFLKQKSDAIASWLFYRRAKRNISRKTEGGNDVYAATTAPLDDESKVMLKSGKSEPEQVELDEVGAHERTSMFDVV